MAHVASMFPTDALGRLLGGQPRAVKMVSSLQRSPWEEATEPCEMVAVWLHVLGGPRQ